MDKSDYVKITMRVEIKNFIIESDTELDYFNDIVNTVIENEKRILNFLD